MRLHIIIRPVIWQTIYEILETQKIFKLDANISRGGGFQTKTNGNCLNSSWVKWSINCHELFIQYASLNGN